MKRSRNEHNSSQEEQEFLRESKLVARSPQHKEKVKQPEPSMDEIKQMLRDLKKDLHEDMAQIKREIQNDIREMREDIKDTKKELQKNREEMKSMAKEITQMKEEWTREKEELHNKIKEVEDKMERMEKQKIRNNLTITGLPTNTDNEDTLEEALEKMFQTELLLKTKIRRAQKIGQDRCIVEMTPGLKKMALVRTTDNANQAANMLEEEMAAIISGNRKNTQEENVPNNSSSSTVTNSSPMTATIH
ncbi:uncharacterized protein PF3D7_1120000-like [Diabrotica virgifera virgifera]|uniref:Uncharacterized protein n=1 Tax=Diabrotica virgifera virgifera TaxID=50390 RepID=A0ABM5L1G2_DIAVI|nr:uncharacterized protein PF3D7_1120000-like [Diabrotica virgifera virgifera]